MSRRIYLYIFYERFVTITDIYPNLIFSPAFGGKKQPQGQFLRLFLCKYPPVQIRFLLHRFARR